jgi:hypothetical protein
MSGVSVPDSSDRIDKLVGIIRGTKSGEAIRELKGLLRRGVTLLAARRLGDSAETTRVVENLLDELHRDLTLPNSPITDGHELLQRVRTRLIEITGEGTTAQYSSSQTNVSPEVLRVALASLRRLPRGVQRAFADFYGTSADEASICAAHGLSIGAFRAMRKRVRNEVMSTETWRRRHTGIAA